MIKEINYKKISLIKSFSFIIVACLLSIGAVYAQEGPDGNGSDCLTCETTNVPFDGGISLLVAAGIGYGAKKAHEARKRTITDTDKRL